MGDWTWKDGDHGALPLRYEPGNWGDILKGEWLCLLLRWFAGQGHKRLVYLDPFSGKPEYPLTAPTRERVALAGGHYAAACRERLPSSATLVREQAEQLGMEIDAHCSDEETEPLSTLRPCDLLLFDPYDFFERWPEWNDAVLAQAASGNVLIYLYNKAPRGASQFRQYRSLRERWKAQPVVLGRVASDAVLPRAWHEVWLAGPAARDARLCESLRAATMRLQQPLLESAWESSCA